MFRYFEAIQKWLSPSFGGGDAPSTQTTVQKAEPWGPAQPFIKDYLGRAQTQSNTPFNFYNGQTIAPFSPEQQLGMNMTTQRALAGSPTLDSANTSLTATLRGDYLSPGSNPWLKDTVDTVMNDVTGRINSQFNNSNFGSTAHQETLQRGLGEVASGMYGDNFARERSYQIGAAGMAPGLAGADYVDAQALMGVGDARRQLAQENLNQIGSVFNQAAGFPQQQLDNYGRAVNLGMGGGYGTTTGTAPNPNQSNPLAGAIGGGMTGYSLANALGTSALGQSMIASNPALTYSMFGPIGAVGGALLGSMFR